MPVNKQELINELTVHGDILYCDENNEYSFFIAINNVNSNSTLETLDNISNLYLLNTYSTKEISSIEEGVYKAIYTNQF